MDQLALFIPEASANRLTKYARMEALMSCPAIEAELLEIFQARPNDWLTWSAYRPVIERHGVGFGLGHKLYSMERRGLLESKDIYLGRGIGAERPGSPNYQGFRTEYKLAEAFPERTA